ncbi:MAG: protein-export membrane protein SecF [Gemmatimonadales bacterium]|nr:MAG: protein-export membrane protein SecF [Gemmatimonadales bacterium]
MFRLFENARYDFLAVRRYAYAATIAVAVPGLSLLAVRGLNESIEFTGGTLLQVEAADPAINTAAIRSALDAWGIRGAEIQTFGAPNEFVIRARLSPNPAEAQETTQETAAAVDSALARAFGADKYTIVRTEAVGPKVGGELRQKALLAIILSFGATLVYLWFRFEWRFGIAAVAATAHDILLTLSFMSLMNLEVTLVVVAAILTIVGYSLNDTIIVFDRVRENLRKYKRQHMYQILNLSVNETLPRTVMTAGTTLVATLALLIFGSEVIRGFAWVMTFGIVIGTFSSIFIASPILLAIERRWPGQDARGARSFVEPRTAQPARPSAAAVT